MEVKKAQNMLEYRDEIYSRPNREWFISDGTKKKIREESKMDAFGDDNTEKRLKV